MRTRFASALSALKVALPVAVMALLLAFQPVMAAAPLRVRVQGEQLYGLACVDGVCRAQLDLGIGAEWLPEGAWLNVMQSAQRQLPGGMGVEVRDDVTITLPTGNLSLADAELVLTLDTTGKIATLRGSALAPVPTFGLLGDLQVVTPARVSVGFDRGDVLTDVLKDISAPLQADRRYFFIDAEAGLHLMAQGMALTSDAGQRATLIVDFAQPLIFVEGHVTLHTDGQMAFIREALGPLGESSWLPTDLPLNQRVMMHLQGQVGRDVEPQLTLGGEYRMDTGMVGRWLQVDAMPLLARGHATIAPQGLMVEGTARSAVQPGQWFDGGAQAQLFVPFAAPDTAALTVGADVAAPALGVVEAATATVAGEAGWMARTGAAAWGGVQQGWNEAGSALQSGYGWLEAGAGDGWAFTQTQWCGLTGLCSDPKFGTADHGTAEQGTQVAAAESPNLNLVQRRGERDMTVRPSLFIIGQTSTQKLFYSARLRQHYKTQ